MKIFLAVFFLVIGSIIAFAVYDLATATGPKRSNARIVDNGAHRDCIYRKAEAAHPDLLGVMAGALIGGGALAFYFGFKFIERYNNIAAIVVLGFCAFIGGGFALTKYIAERGQQCEKVYRPHPRPGNA